MQQIKDDLELILPKIWRKIREAISFIKQELTVEDKPIKDTK